MIETATTALPEPDGPEAAECMRSRIAGYEVPAIGLDGEDSDGNGPTWEA